jgi:hypothetical protein
MVLLHLNPNTVIGSSPFTTAIAAARQGDFLGGVFLNRFFGGFDGQ